MSGPLTKTAIDVIGDASVFVSSPVILDRIATHAFGVALT